METLSGEVLAMENFSGSLGCLDLPLSEHSWHARMGFGSHPGEIQIGFESETAETRL